MSSTFVKLAMASRQVAYLRADLLSGVFQQNTHSNLGLELSGTPSIIQLSGKDAGEAIEGTVIKANQKVEIGLGVFRPHRFHALIVVNPALHKAGVVGVAQLVEPEEQEPIAFSFRPDHQIDLAELDWIVRLYLID